MSLESQIRGTKELNKKAVGPVGFSLIVVVMVAIVAGVSYSVWVATKVTFTDMVIEKWIKSSGDSNQVYLVSTTNHGVLQDTDEFLFLKFCVIRCVRCNSARAYLHFHGHRVACSVPVMVPKHSERTVTHTRGERHGHA